MTCFSHNGYLDSSLCTCQDRLVAGSPIFLTYKGFVLGPLYKTINSLVCLQCWKEGPFREAISSLTMKETKVDAGGHSVIPWLLLGIVTETCRCVQWVTSSHPVPSDNKTSSEPGASHTVFKIFDDLIKSPEHNMHSSNGVRVIQHKQLQSLGAEFSTDRRFKFLSFFFCLAMPHGLQDLSSPTRDATQAIVVKAWSPNHWTTRELPRRFTFHL